jgi:hypothetical protein
MDNTLERFWSKVTITPGCWVRSGSPIGAGYTMIRVEGRKTLAHRFSFELHVRLLGVGEKVLHSCDNPPCVNPDHLSAGSQFDNIRDMNTKGRNGHKAKTHCPHGHEYGDDNTYVAPNGARHCKECRRARDRARH